VFFFFYNRASIRFPFFVVCFAHSGGVQRDER
jgi:hypothetical protein